MWILNGIVANDRMQGASTRVGDGPITEVKSDISSQLSTRAGSDE